MQVFTADPAVLASEHDILIGRWEQYAGVGETPFGAMWCVVPPGGRSNLDCHSERELWVVVQGDAEVESGQHSRFAPAGSAVLLESQEPHVMVNRSADEPLIVLSLYWEPGAPGQADAG